MIRIGKIGKDEEEYYFAFDNGKWRQIKVKNKIWRSMKGLKYMEGEIDEQNGTIIKRIYKHDERIFVNYYVIYNGDLKELELNCEEKDKIFEKILYVCDYENKIKFYQYEGNLFEDKIQLQNYIYNKLKKDFDNELIKVEGKVKVETDKAYLFSIKGKEIWIPKSICTLGEGYIEVPLWFAKSKSLISNKEYNQIINEKMKKYESELSKIVFI
ncbi:hypothetical protein [Sulfurisphaera tokodaii]|uniref:Uncharacterized protein n=2 Tax=Sulfurisphaera tokodaii TaxID=111955 RepID=Q96XR0_SULTO|nr:hypothetical protein [Sulfurisphaera tokodaii]BAB67567.1 hypothetical protein STK_24560 [Sulfurisphaera tokodaii str. 7]HII74568.1 hypothetical protein [Sulfurisphaera tokodaii]